MGDVAVHAPLRQCLGTVPIAGDGQKSGGQDRALCLIPLPGPLCGDVGAHPTRMEAGRRSRSRTTTPTRVAASGAMNAGAGWWTPDSPS